LDSETRSIVLLGSFTPEIFHPGWFASRGLLRDDEAEKSVIELMAPELAMFRLPWGELRALANRVDFTIVEPTAYEAGRDLIASLARIVSFPVRSVGLNYHNHWKMPSENLLDRLATAAAEVMATTELTPPHLQTLDIRAEREDADYPGSVGMTLQPSSIVTGGIYISVNDHYDIDDNDSESRTEQLIDVLGTRWDSAGSMGAALAQRLIEATVSSG
jgi:hypothetical protein